MENEAQVGEFFHPLIKFILTIEGGGVEKPEVENCNAVSNSEKNEDVLLSVRDKACAILANSKPY